VSDESEIRKGTLYLCHAELLDCARQRILFIEGIDHDPGCHAEARGIYAPRLVESLFCMCVWISRFARNDDIKGLSSFY
jgi:hypothetical protein